MFGLCCGCCFVTNWFKINLVNVAWHPFPISTVSATSSLSSHLLISPLQVLAHTPGISWHTFPISTASSKSVPRHCLVATPSFVTFLHMVGLVCAHLPHNINPCHRSRDCDTAPAFLAAAGLSHLLTNHSITFCLAAG